MPDPVVLEPLDDEYSDAVFCNPPFREVTLDRDRLNAFDPVPKRFRAEKALVIVPTELSLAPPIDGALGADVAR